MARDSKIGVTYIWPDRLLSICRLPPNSLHRIPLKVFNLNLEQPFHISRDGLQWLTCRSTLWLENEQHQSSYDDSLMAVMIFEPITTDGDFIQSKMKRKQSFYCDYAYEEPAISLFKKIYQTRPDATTAYQMQAEALGLDRQNSRRLLDKRVIKAIDLVNANPASDTSVDTLSKYVNLSKHYFIRLFRRETNVSYSQYRTFARIRHSIILLSKGYTLTRAALEVGFTDVAHLSNAYRKIFGMKASETTKLSAGVDYFIDESLLKNPDRT